VKLSAGLAGGIVRKPCGVRIRVVASEAVAADCVTGRGVLRERDNAIGEFRKEQRGLIYTLNAAGVVRITLRSCQKRGD
jgi:hypothetical protein